MSILGELCTNTTHGSGWMIPMVSTRPCKLSTWNPTNGSWWMVQIPIEISTHYRGWDYGSVRELFVEGIGTNPPTTVGGLRSRWVTKGVNQE